MGGSKTPSVTYTTAPNNQQAFGIVSPMLQQASYAAQTGMPLYNVPSAYNIPSTPTYSATQLPTLKPTQMNPILPTSDLMNSLAPEVKAGLWQPYEQGANALSERLNQYGMLGNERGGLSGQSNAAFGKYYENAAKDVGLSSWGMIAPQLNTAAEANFNAANQANLANWGANVDVLNTANANNWNAALAQWGAQVDQSKTDYASRLAALQAPWSVTPGLMNSITQIPYSAQTQQPGFLSNMLNAGGMFGMASLGSSIFNPIGSALGKGLGGLFGKLF